MREFFSHKIKFRFQTLWIFNNTLLLGAGIRRSQESNGHYHHKWRMCRNNNIFCRCLLRGAQFNFKGYLFRVNSSIKQNKKPEGKQSGKVKNVGDWTRNANRKQILIMHVMFGDLHWHRHPHKYLSLSFSRFSTCDLLAIHFFFCVVFIRIQLERNKLFYGIYHKLYQVHR